MPFKRFAGSRKADKGNQRQVDRGAQHRLPPAGSLLTRPVQTTRTGQGNVLRGRTLRGVSK